MRPNIFHTDYCFVPIPYLLDFLSANLCSKCTGNQNANRKDVVIRASFKDNQPATLD